MAQTWAIRSLKNALESLGLLQSNLTSKSKTLALKELLEGSKPMTLQYEIQVKGLVVDGHPHQLVFTDLTTASRVYDQLCKKHQNYDIVFSEYTKIELKNQKAKVRVPKECPRGHTGISDGRSILSQGTNGLWNCKVCGDFFK
jgi:hypothetical protein